MPNKTLFVGAYTNALMATIISFEGALEHYIDVTHHDFSRSKTIPVPVRPNDGNFLVNRSTRSVRQ